MKIRKMLQDHLASIAVVLLLSSAIAFGQEFRGTITGRVIDPNGAVIPNATVVVKNVETNIESTLTTNEEGAFTAPLLNPGKYSVAASAQGFKRGLQDSVNVGVGDRISLDMQLEIGSGDALVNVSADTELIERGSVTTGSTISARQIEELPLAEGAPYSLATQSPGMVYTGDPNFQGPTANGNLAGFRSNGTVGNQVNRSGGNVINLDGSPNLAYDGQVAFTPPSSATQEFKVQTNAFDAQMGFTAGATVNVATKSGTNKFHGEGYYYNRDKSRTANNFFNNKAGLARPERKYYRYGATVTGPIFKDRTFFMASYESQNDNVAQTTTYSVPTKLMREGNFSELAYPIYDPATAFMGNTTCGLTGTLGTVCRTAFAGNIIPTNRMYAPALAFMKLFPEPNLPGIQNNFITDQNLHRPYKSYMGRIDHSFSDSTRIFGKFYKSYNTEDRYNLTMEEGSIFQGYEDRRNIGGNVGVTSTLSSSMIFDVRASFGKFELERYQTGQPTVADLGFTGFPTSRQNNIFPRFDFTNFLTVGSLRADYGDGRLRPFDMFTLQPTMTQIWGQHTTRYGYDYRRMHETFDNAGDAAGRFQFGGNYTMQASNSGSTEQNRPGREIASFLLGIPVASSNSRIDNPTIYDVSSEYHGVFVQDDWRVTSKLTLNLGLRYEVETGFKERNGQMSVDFDRSAPLPIAPQVLTNYNANVPAGVPAARFQSLTGGFIFADSGKVANQRADWNNWQPRIGLSYALTPKTVIRAGFGVFTSPFQIISQSVVFQPGFSSSTLFVPTTDTGRTFIATLANPFPNGLANSPGNSQALMTFVGRDLTSVGNNGPTTVIFENGRKNANYSRYIFGVQRELWGGVGVEATYIYSRGSNLAVNRELNFIPRNCVRSDNGNPCLVDLATANSATLVADLASASTYLNQTVANPFRTLVPAEATWNSNTIQRRRLLTQFPQFGNVSVVEYNGTSSFNSLQLQFVKRFSKSLSLNASYTWMRDRLKDQYLNPQDTELTEYISPFDRPNRYTFSGIYELPIGKGRAIGDNWHPVVNAIIGGWQIQGLAEWQQGEPFVLPNAYYNGDPKQLKSLMGKKDGQGRRYGVDIPAWDISGFSIGTVVPGVANNYTSSSAVTLRSLPITLDGMRNAAFLKFDAGLSKNFRISEGMKIQIRVEAINILNKPYFSAPGITPSAAGFAFTQAPVRQPPRDIQIGGRFTF